MSSPTIGLFRTTLPTFEPAGQASSTVMSSVLNSAVWHSARSPRAPADGLSDRPSGIVTRTVFRASSALPASAVARICVVTRLATIGLAGAATKPTEAFSES